MNEIKVDTFDQFHEVISDIKNKLSPEKLWFRGQENSKWRLAPGIFRQNTVTTHNAKGRKLKKGEITFSSGARVEGMDLRVMIQQFKRRFKMTNSNALPKDDLQWQLLMQHHGVPTRFLDWTTDASVALFFAIPQFEKIIKNNTHEEASVWVISPGRVNDQSILHKKPITLKQCAELDMPWFPICIVPPQIHERVLRQKSVLTLHGLYTLPIDYYDLLSKDIYKINIPSGAFLDIKKEMIKRKITASRYFDGVESIAKEVTERAHVAFLNKHSLW